MNQEALAAFDAVWVVGGLGELMRFVVPRLRARAPKHTDVAFGRFWRFGMSLRSGNAK